MERGLDRVDLDPGDDVLDGQLDFMLTMLLRKEPHAQGRDSEVRWRSASVAVSRPSLPIDDVATKHSQFLMECK